MVSNRQSIFGVAVVIAIAVTVIAAMRLYWSHVQRAPGVDFSAYSAGRERKQAFIDFLLPLVGEENRRIFKLRSRLLAIHERQERGRSARTFVGEVAAEYGLEEFPPEDEGGWQRLLLRVDIAPASMVLAQGAVESGWGTSRFAREGANLFGQWCYRKGCGIVPGSRDRGATHEVAVFASPRESLRRYLRNLNTHAAYREFRERRAQLRATGDPVKGVPLVQTLTGYSSRGSDYVADLLRIIRSNDLARFDLPAGTTAAAGSR